MAGATPRADMTSTLHLGFAAWSVGDVSWRQASRTAVDFGGEGVEGELESFDEGEEAGGLAPGDLVGHL